MPVSENEVRNAVVVARGDGRKIHVLGDDVTIKVSSRDTGGRFAVFEGSTRPQGGPPLHIHHEHDEYWYIVDGEYLFEVDGKEIYVGPGSTVFAPKGSVHTFQNIGEKPGKTITTVVPGGLDIFFEEFEKAAPRGAVPDIAKLTPVADKYNIELAGPPLAARPAVAASDPKAR